MNLPRDSKQKPLYQIKPVGKKYAIFRPDKTKVNGWEWSERKMAEKYLELLVAYNICRSE